MSGAIRFEIDSSEQKKIVDRLFDSKLIRLNNKNRGLFDSKMIWNWFQWIKNIGGYSIRNWFGIDSSEQKKNRRPAIRFETDSELIRVNKKCLELFDSKLIRVNKKKILARLFDSKLIRLNNKNRVLFDSKLIRVNKKIASYSSRRRSIRKWFGIGSSEYKISGAIRFEIDSSE